MKYKKILTMLMTASMLASMPVGARAAAAASRVTTDATIDTTKKGSVTLHKLINNDGYNSEADGMGHDTNGSGGITSASANHGTPLDKIVFSYKKIANIVNVADSTQTGTYFATLDDGFKSIAKAHGADLTGKTIGSTIYYTTDQVEAMVNKVNADDDGEQQLNAYLKTNGTAMTPTNASGSTASGDIDLGLYLFGETDISAHDGLDAKGSKIVTERGQANPEAPIVESPASPFLVSVPTTNITTVDGKVAGSTWIYNEDIYPKDQNTELVKRIVDPDEDTARTLRTSEDYQIGDTIEQVIYADVPRLQPNKHHRKYVVTDTMTSGLTFDKVTKVVLGPKVASPTKESDFAGFTALVKDTDYTVVPEKGGQTFAVKMTPAGLAKLDGVSKQSQVVVYFNSTLNKDAKIGTDPSNENHPTLTWKNSNTDEHEIDGNRVYDYTYELDVQKTGLTDASHAVFTVVRKDTHSRNTDVKFVAEGDGIYHVYDAAHGDTDEKQVVTKISPAKDGKLHVKGLDSDAYTFKEIQTEQNKSLLKTTFTVTFKEPNEPEHDGDVVATVTTPDTTTPQKLTCQAGIAKLTVNNYKAITLRTGGEGRTMIYLMGMSAMAAAGIGAMVIGRKKKEEQD